MLPDITREPQRSYNQNQAICKYYHSSIHPQSAGGMVTSLMRRVALGIDTSIEGQGTSDQRTSHQRGRCFRGQGERENNLVSLSVDCQYLYYSLQANRPCY